MEQLAVINIPKNIELEDDNDVREMNLSST